MKPVMARVSLRHAPLSSGETDIPTTACGSFRAPAAKVLSEIMKMPIDALTETIGWARTIAKDGPRPTGRECPTASQTQRLTPRPISKAC